MIIDCHSHYTTVPTAHTRFREAQRTWLAQPDGSAPVPEPVSDDEIRDSIEPNQLAQMGARGVDFMIFSPQASAMEHHISQPDIARDWAMACNDIVHRVATLFPQNFAAMAQLPQTPPLDGVATSLESSITELRRCVEELGFVGANVNPDPSGGRWTSPPITDRYWYPLYEALVDLDVPAMIHVSSSRNPNFHALGAHYLNADTSVFMQLVEGDLFADFPTLRLVIPHGGGAVPYHWGRYRGLADRLGRPTLDGHLMRNVFFDTCVYHQAGIDLLLDVVDTDNILFASEMIGAVRGIDPLTGRHWDDTKHYVERAHISDEQRARVFEHNALRVYPRLAQRLAQRSA